MTVQRPYGLRSISLFSGIGGLDYGLERAGIETELQVENDYWCQQILERHWPEVNVIGDVRDCGARTLRASGYVDPDEFRDRGIVHGGFPCQDVSLAGRRAGLSGERSSLWFEFYRVVRELRPRWVVVENVPGLLSSYGGRDFGLILGGLADLGFGVAWRVLDARWFGTPQRRRRIFIVGCAGDRRSAEAVLGVCESCGGHSSARHEAWQTPGAEPADRAADGFAGSLIDAGMARPLVARQTGYRMDIESENFVAYPLRASDGHHGWSAPRGDGNDNLVTGPQQGVRRLTPLECERLQGFPDGWTEGPADAHRYRMLGNAVNTVVAQWLGHRLAWVDRAQG